jgi:hypothetical protein
MRKPLISPDQRADANRRRDRRLDRPFRNIDQRQRGHVGQREVRADAQIDPAREHNNRQADDDQSEFADLPRDVGDVSDRGEVWNRRREKNRQRDEQGDGNDIVHPPPAEHLADHVIGDISIA